MYHILDENGFYVGISVESPDDHKHFTEVEISGNFLKFKFDGKSWVEGSTMEELDEKRDETILMAYEQRKLDGWNAYQTFRKDMVKELYDGELSKQRAFIIEDYLGVGYDKIAQQGDWETAYFKLSQIVISDEQSFVKLYLEKAKRVMLDYIKENYKPM